MVLPTAVWAQDSLTTVADSLKTTTAIPVEAVVAATEEPTVLNSGNTAWIIVATVTPAYVPDIEGILSSRINCACFVIFQCTRIVPVKA